MDVPTLIRRVKRSFGDDGDVMLSNPQDYLDWANEAQMRIVRETNCLTATLSQAASTFPVAYPADFLRLRRVLYGTVALQEINVEDLDAKAFDTTVKDAPIFFYFLNNTIALYPTPLASDSTSVSLQYTKTPTSLALISDALTVPVHYHDDIVNWCLYRAHERNENWQAADHAMDLFNKALGLRVEDTVQVEDTYTIIRDDPYEVGWM